MILFTNRNIIIRGALMARERWSSQFGFLMAAVGSAIGLGNIWRFSYMAYEYGGGAFLIPYLVALVTAGLPLLILEFAIGHERIGSAPLAYAKLSHRGEWLGWWAVIFVMFGIELYYTTVISWCANYFALSFNLGWGEDTGSYFIGEFLKRSDAPFNIGGVQGHILLGLVVVWGLNWFILARGVQRGVELANRIFMPLLFILTAVLVFWSLTLDGAMDGIKAYLKPDFSAIMDVKVWIAAYGQIFFTLSLGFGIMIAYASYLPKKANITRGALLTGLINSGYSLFAGFAVFSVLGFMAAEQGKPLADVVADSVGLAFIAYPKAVSLMPGGNIFGAIFFLCLFVAGMSSSISIMEAFTSALVDKFNYRRGPVVNFLSIAGFLGSIIFATRGGLYWLDIADHFLNQYGLVTVGVLECVLVCWFFKLDIIKEHINKYSTFQVGKGWELLVRYFIPLVLGIILIKSIVGELKEPYEGYPWSAIIIIGLGWILITLAAAVVLAKKPWKEGRLDYSPEE
jgi:NSS family neurotransmitter:Na+ symporter